MPARRVRSIWGRIANEYAMKMDVFLLFERVVRVKIAHFVQGFKTTPLGVIDFIPCLCAGSSKWVICANMLWRMDSKDPQHIVTC
jgi:hypothetical protein